MAAYVRRRNAHAEPKTAFTPRLTHPDPDPVYPSQAA
jgi:hypothetical protein